jgi:hypothetical protein
MKTPMVLAFAPQRKSCELEVVLSAGDRELAHAFFRCRTGQSLRPSGDALFCLGLYIASEVGAPLRIVDLVDADLLARAQQITGLFRRWWPDCRAVELEVLAAQPQRQGGPLRGTGLFLSCGVDSSYSLTTERDRLSALVTLLGPDIDLRDTAASARLEASCHALASRNGLVPIVIETNVGKAFHAFAGWIEHHGSALAAIAHMLSDQLSHMLIASSGNESSWMSPWGSHPALDPMFSSGCMTIEHHGLLSRFDKIATIVGDDFLLYHLRVCNRAATNCGVCDKCVFAMRALEILRAERRAVTFPSFIPRRGGLKVVDDAFRTEIERLLGAAIDAGRDDLRGELEHALRSYRSTALLKRLGYGRYRIWSRVLRHRQRWRRQAT